MKRLIVIFCILFCGRLAAQDQFINIGKLTLRYDLDSNRARFGFWGSSSPVGPLRLAKEGNGALFDFDNNYFQWIPGTGLSLIPSLSRDSLSLQKDTSESENLYTKRWSLKRKYFGWYDSLALKYFYYNSKSNTTAEFWAINQVFQHSNTETIGLDAYADMDTLMVSKKGMYQITYSVQYEFINAVGSCNCADSIWFRIKAIPIESESWASIVYPSGFSAGMVGSVSWSVVFKITSDNTPIYLQGRGVSNNSLIHLKHRDVIIATLIH